MKVLIAVDNSKFASEVMQAVAQRSWPVDAEFLILDVVETCSIAGSTENFVNQCRILLDSKVTALSKRLPHHKVEGEVTEGSAKEQIVEVADQYGADLIMRLNRSVRQAMAALDYVYIEALLRFARI